MKIEDGTGKLTFAAVSNQNRLEVDSVTEVEFAHISETEGDAYNLVSDHVSITNTNGFAFLYMKNDTERDVYIHSLRTCSWAKNKWALKRNITSGTIISDARVAGAPNLNSGSGKVSGVTCYVGGTGNTAVGGTLVDQWMHAEGHSEEFLNGGLIMTPGTSLTLTGTLDATGEACARIIFYFKAKD